MSQSTGSAGTSTTPSLSDATQQVKQDVTQATSSLRDQATTQANNQLDMVAQTVDEVAQAIHQVGEQLRSNQQGTFAEYADRAAEQLDLLKRYLQDHDIREIVDDVTNYARRQPAIFLTGAFALGLLASRFLKSNPTQANPSRVSATGPMAAPQASPNSATFTTPRAPLPGQVSGMPNMPPYHGYPTDMGENAADTTPNT